jgi:protein-tyrosine phosphatase
MHGSRTGTQRSSPENSQLDVPCNGTSTLDLRLELANIRDFIDNARAPNRTSAVLVHYQQGRSRSTMVEIAYLMRTNRWSINKALEHVSSKR